MQTHDLWTHFAQLTPSKTTMTDDEEEELKDTSSSLESSSESDLWLGSASPSATVSAAAMLAWSATSAAASDAASSTYCPRRELLRDAGCTVSSGASMTDTFRLLCAPADDGSGLLTSETRMRSC